MATQREINQELDKLEPAIRAEFLEMVSTVVGSITLTRVVTAMDDLDDLMDEVGITRPAANDLLEAVRDTYKRGGVFEAPSARIRFDYRNEQAERWLAEHSSQFVTRIQTQQREAIRQAVETGTRLGQNPRQTALDIAGRVSGQTGRRSGGIVGLSDNQARYVSNAREQLRSGDPAQMREYLTRSRRDRRFDGIVNRAIEAGRPVPRSDMERIVGRYSDRLLQTRGETIARTEAMQAFNSARDQAWEQSIEEGVVQRQNVTKVWRSAGDGNVRHTHAALNRETVDKDEAFVSPTGARLMYPGDTSMGAPASEIVNCRCTYNVRADFLAEAS